VIKHILFLLSLLLSIVVISAIGIFIAWVLPIRGVELTCVVIPVVACLAIVTSIVLPNIFYK